MVKIINRKKVSKKKYGKVIFRNNNMEDHEKLTVFRLASFGFDIETLPASDMPGSKNPDLFLLGTFWEMKCPTSTNKATIQKKFHKACRQSGGKAVFDLCRVNGDERVRDYILELFRSSRKMKHIMIIEDEENLLDITK